MRKVLLRRPWQNLYDTLQDWLPSNRPEKRLQRRRRDVGESNGANSLTYTTVPFTPGAMMLFSKTNRWLREQEAVAKSGPDIL